MWSSNNALVPDPDKQDILASKPFDWPFLHLGLRMCGWGDNQTKYYLLGTPIIYWGSTISLILSVFIVGVYLIRQQRKYVDMEPSAFIVAMHSTISLIVHPHTGEWDHFLYVAKIAMSGWIFHFGMFILQPLNSEVYTTLPVPFLIMGRVTYVHHYVSSVCFTLTPLSAHRYYSIAPYALLCGAYVRAPA